VLRCDGGRYLVLFSQTQASGKRRLLHENCKRLERFSASHFCLHILPHRPHELFKIFGCIDNLKPDPFRLFLIRADSSGTRSREEKGRLRRYLLEPIIADSQKKGGRSPPPPRANAREHGERYDPRSLPGPDHARPGVTLRNPRSSPRPPVTGPPVPAGEDQEGH